MTIILIALKKESNGLIEQTASRHGWEVHYTGMGMLAATQKTTEIICKYQPRRIINLGTAGSRHIQVGQVVECQRFSNRTVHLLEKLKYTIEAEPLTTLPQVHCGSSDHIDLSAAARDYEILDMEAFAMASVCKKMNVPFHAIKYITDDSQGDVSSKWQEQLQTVAASLQKTLEDLIRDQSHKLIF